MQKRITNTTNSPYDIPSNNGMVRVPAFGTVDGEFDAEYIELLTATGSITVEDATDEAEPVSKRRSANRKEK